MEDGPRKPRRVWAQDVHGQWRIDILPFTDIEFAHGLARGDLYRPRDWPRCKEIIAEHGLRIVTAIASVIVAVAAVTGVLLALGNR